MFRESLLKKPTVVSTSFRVFVAIACVSLLTVGCAGSGDSSSETAETAEEAGTAASGDQAPAAGSSSGTSRPAPAVRTVTLQPGASVPVSLSQDVVSDTAVVGDWLAKSEGYEVVGEAVTDDNYFGTGFGIAVTKGNQELLNKLNQGLAELKANGTYDSLYGKYFPH